MRSGWRIASASAMRAAEGIADDMRFFQAQRVKKAEGLPDPGVHVVSNSAWSVGEAKPDHVGGNDAMGFRQFGKRRQLAQALTPARSHE